MVISYAEKTFQYQSLEDKTQLLVENINNLITSENVTVEDIECARQAAISCDEVFAEARDFANLYVTAQINKPFPPHSIRYNGEKINFEGLTELYDASYTLEDGFQRLGNRLLDCLEEETLSPETKEQLQKAVEDLTWLKEQLPNFSSCDDSVKGMIFTYYLFLQEAGNSPGAFLCS
jgi:hypothetical protein